jgi:lipooligosaccharide transport system ATP-binding protein
MTDALIASGLVKLYGERRVVDGLDLVCRQGTVLGLLGPNGAGKTTTLRMLYGFLKPDSGGVRYFGRDFALERESLKRELGVCTQEDSLDYDLGVEENLRVYARYFRPGVPDLNARIAELMATFGLESYAKASPHALSGGYKRRLMIARSVIHKPRVLFLDEPTTGLDPKARVDVWQLVDTMRSQGMAVVLTTHYMDEAERLSDDLLVMHKGRAIARGTTRAVVGEALGEQVLVLGPRDDARAEICAFVEERGWLVNRVLDEVHVPLTTADLESLRARFAGTRLRLREPTLDDLFLRLAVDS